MKLGHWFKRGGKVLGLVLLALALLLLVLVGRAWWQDRNLRQTCLVLHEGDLLNSRLGDLGSFRDEVSGLLRVAGQNCAQGNRDAYTESFGVGACRCSFELDPCTTRLVGDSRYRCASFGD